MQASKATTLQGVLPRKGTHRQHPCSKCCAGESRPCKEDCSPCWRRTTHSSKGSTGHPSALPMPTVGATQCSRAACGTTLDDAFCNGGKTK